MLLRLCFLLTLLVLPFRDRATAAETRPPNIVVILADDLGWADLGCYGSRFHETPNLDRLAAQGMRFTDAYATAPVCSPTRASLLTGRHPARLHLTDWLPGRPDMPAQKMQRPAISTNLPLTEITLAERLKAAGYATVNIGKWHLGGAGFSPREQGFDVNIAGDQRGTPASYFAPYRDRQGGTPGVDDSPEGEYLTDRLTAAAERFIAGHRDQPFFLYLPHFAVHIPLAARPELIAKYRERSAAGMAQTNAIYAAMLESLDASVGRVLAKLDELQLAGNTIVVFTSDNGGLSVREGPNTPATSNTPWRAGKGYLYEGGLRVPLIVRWPGHISAGEVNATPVISADLFPTLLAAAGQTPSPEPALDGVDLLPLLTKSGEVKRERLFWHYPHYSNQGGKPGGAVREGDFKLIEHYESGHLELFNLKTDPGETNDLANGSPQKANDLARLLAEWRRRLGAQMMTTNAAWVLAPITPGDDGNIVLPAHEGIVHGTMLRYEPPAHKNTLGYWVKPEDWVSWPLEIPQAGEYVIEVLQGCGKGSGGSEVEVTVGAEKLRFTVQDTGHFQNFIPREIGRVTLPAGRHTLAVKPIKKPGAAVMDLRQVVLKPVTAPGQ